MITLESTSNIENSRNSKLIWLLKENLMQSIYDNSSWINSIDWLEHRDTLFLLSPLEIKIRVEEMIESWFGNINIPLRRKNIEKSLAEFISCYQKIINRPDTTDTEGWIGEELLSIIEIVRKQHSETFKLAA